MEFEEKAGVAAGGIRKNPTSRAKNAREMGHPRINLEGPAQ
jgi:hypothetical protein